VVRRNGGRGGVRRRARLLAREPGVREHAALLEHAPPVSGAARRRALHNLECGVQRATHAVQACRHPRKLEAPRRAPLGFAEDGGDQRSAVLRRRRVREPNRAPQLLSQPLGDVRVLAAADAGGGVGRRVEGEGHVCVHARDCGVGGSTKGASAWAAAGRRSRRGQPDSVTHVKETTPARSA
jgi:hypothetical protein